MFKGIGLVGFVDMLGFTARVEDTWEAAEPALDLILDMKRRVRDQVWGGIVLEGHERRTPSVSSLSDSIVLQYCFPDADDQIAIVSALATMAYQIFFLREMALDAGFALRGGIELGKIYVDERDIIGPAFNAAYELESRIASSARVVIGPAIAGAVAKITDHEGFAQAVRNECFYQSADSLICVAARKPDVIERMKDLRALAADRPLVASKYDEIVRAMEEGWRAGDLARWARGAAAAEAKVREARVPKAVGPATAVTTPKSTKRQMRRARGRR